jgi:methylmalonyl-CoA/ethylmalonyl-CoA epimerase
MREQPPIRLHHLGIAVRSIAKQGAGYCEMFGIEAPGQPVNDELQKVRVAFADLGNGVAIEFVEPLGEDSPIQRILNRGGGLYHVCYEVSDLEAHVERVRARGGLLVNGPVPASAFGGRRIAFVYTPGHDLVEFVEVRKPH